MNQKRSRLLKKSPPALEKLQSVCRSFPCYEHSANLSQTRRADERTRTADLLITSELLDHRTIDSLRVSFLLSPSHRTVTNVRVGTAGVDTVANS